MPQRLGGGCFPPPWCISLTSQVSAVVLLRVGHARGMGRAAGARCNFFLSGFLKDSEASERGKDAPLANHVDRQLLQVMVSQGPVPGAWALFLWEHWASCVAGISCILQPCHLSYCMVPWLLWLSPTWHSAACLPGS